MSNKNKNHTHNTETKSGAGRLKPLMVEHLANQMKLEELSKLTPDENNDFAFEQSISDIMLQQEKILQELCGFEIQNIVDAKRVLKVWVAEEINPKEVSIEQQLIFNVCNFLEDLAA